MTWLVSLDSNRLRKSVIAHIMGALHVCLVAYFHNTSLIFMIELMLKERERDWWRTKNNGAGKGGKKLGGKERNRED